MTWRITKEDWQNITEMLRSGHRFTLADALVLLDLDPGKDFRGINLRGTSWRGCNLAGFDFSGANLTGADLCGADLTRARGLDRAILDGIRINNATRGIPAKDGANVSPHGREKRRATNSPSARRRLERLFRERISAAKDPRTAPERLAELADDEHPHVRRRVAERIKDPLILAKLASDNEEIVRRAVAGNRSTPPDVLADLAHDLSWEVRRIVGQHPVTPPHALAVLGDDSEWRVRWVVALNPATPAGVLDNLSNKRPDMEAVAVNPSTPEEVLYRLAGNSSDLVRERLACFNKSISERTALKLARDPNGYVRDGIAGNPAAPLPPLIRKKLKADPGHDERWPGGIRRGYRM